MNILISTIQYLMLSGAETLTFTIIKELRRQGLNIYLYSPFLGGDILKRTKKIGIRCSDNLEDFRKIKFDIIHCQHNITSIIIKYYFPKTPLVYLMLGPKPFLEKPPEFIEFNYYGGISSEIDSYLSRIKISEQKRFVFPNSVDTKRFKPVNEISKKPKSMLLLSNRLSPYSVEIVKIVCKKLGLRFKWLGAHNSTPDIEKQINKVDIVMSLGRGAIEAMSCARAVLVFAHDGNLYKDGDGMVTKNNISNLAKRNFSGRTKKIEFNEQNIINETSKYSKAMGELNRKYVTDNLNISKNISTLIEVYEKAAKEEPLPYKKDKTEYVAKIIGHLLEYEKLSYYKRDFYKYIIHRTKSQLKRILIN